MPLCVPEMNAEGLWGGVRYYDPIRTRETLSVDLRASSEYPRLDSNQHRPLCATSLGGRATTGAGRPAGAIRLIGRGRASPDSGGDGQPAWPLNLLELEQVLTVPRTEDEITPCNPLGTSC